MAAGAAFFTLAWGLAVEDEEDSDQSYLDIAAIILLWDCCYWLCSCESCRSGPVVCSVSILPCKTLSLWQ